jgi:hydroxymethylbilane synthase
MWQAEFVAGQLKASHPGLAIEFVKITTQGDRFLDAPLAAIGGKGLFVREIEQALLEEKIDLAVHSLKDLPGELPQGLTLAAPPPREDPRDALVGRDGRVLATLPENARVGTSSLRREVQVKALRPDLRVLPVRGNVQTRLDKAIGSGPTPLDAVLLAHAGLVRLGLAAKATELFDPARFVPAIGQGILGIEHRAADARVAKLLAPLGDRAAAVAASCERALLARLGAGCHVPLGGHAVVGRTVKLTAVLGDPETLRLHRVEREGPIEKATELGREVGAILLEGEGGRILARAPREAPPES